MASIKRPIKYGMRTLVMPAFEKTANKSDTGIIQRALANFTVVATSNALSPYISAAPTTELVS